MNSRCWRSSRPESRWVRLAGGARREEAFAVASAEQEREAGEVVAERSDAVCLAADEAGQGLVERGVADREPVVQELHELGELHGIGAVEAYAHVRCPAALRWLVTGLLLGCGRAGFLFPGPADRRGCRG